VRGGGGGGGERLGPVVEYNFVVCVSDFVGCVSDGYVYS
jgi:hypothetical protein